MPNIPTNKVSGDTNDAAYYNNIGTVVHGLNGYGPYSAMPAAGITGRTWRCSDCDSEYLDTGSAWVRTRFGINGFGAYPPPDQTGWTQSAMNSGSSITQDKDSRLMEVVPVNGDNWRIEYKTLSTSSNYIVSAHFEYAGVNTPSIWQGLILRDGSGKLISFGFSYGASNFDQWIMACMKWNSITSYNSDYARNAGTTVNGGHFNPWLRIRDDGTNRYFEYSQNGMDWSRYASHGRTDFMTATQWGWGANANFAPASGVTTKIRAKHLGQV